MGELISTSSTRVIKERGKSLAPVRALNWRKVQIMRSACQTVNCALGLRWAQEVCGDSSEQMTSLRLPSSWMVRTNVQRTSILSFSRGLAYWGGGQGKFMVWRSSSPVSPWCSIACASWTEWWHHRVSAEGPGGNLLQRPAVSHWDVRSLPGSSRQQDTENQTKDNFIKGFHIQQSDHVHTLYTMKH